MTLQTGFDAGFDTGFDTRAIDAQTPEQLAATCSDKWTRYPGCAGAFIAEMDLGLAPCIQDALVDAVRQCELGYISDPWKRRVAEACAAWQHDRYGWDVDPACIRPVPDVLEAFEVFLREFVGSGRSIVVPTPAYMPFLSVPRLYGVDVIEIPMLRAESASDANDGWLFDFDAIRRAFEDGCRAFVLCNPHNPIGKVLTVDEMRAISALADEYGVRIFNDEIHAPFVFDGRHVPFATICATAAMQSMTATSASKAFNIPGIKCAQVILTNPDDLKVWMDRAEWSEHQTATIGAVGAEAAYRGGAAWLDQALAYLRRNERLLTGEMAERFPGVRYVPPAGTYIAWLDFTELGIADPAAYFRERAKVAMTAGTECGSNGAGCARFNFAMPYPLLKASLERMHAALAEDGLVPMEAQIKVLAR
ncbi:MalY/PatB family protein [Bifidobacterium avesanii]|uniref:cysteine-S-conjugate beta-lyase n=1 Tax=Bifidobacterium avesanii TaxID=1798157 RepID=A0A7K3TEJ4_9BIFI|nr:aminotransferase class I/II-fold pyridoxal phosphate-dependent enzyme [Bifidobacterium avesanii]NEG77511.1 aminotransferase class I/II-fold pyridoxal phosphate-dependent enzyme [Bifidobacterium avesanii]